jgi:GR25 family glycosyltransferase involved in LPS biosynthesis
MGVTWPSWLPDGAAACSVSHKVLLGRIGRDASSQRALVLEDDVVFVPDFPKRFEQIDSETRTDCGFIQLGWLPTPAEDRAAYRWRHRAAQSQSLRSVARLIRPSIKREYRSTIVARPAFGTHCYLVSRTTADALSECIGPHVFSPVDILFQIYHDLKASFGGSAFRRTRFPLAVQDWSLGSDVEPNRFAAVPRQLDAYGRVVKLEDWPR